MDETDRKILRILQADAATPIAQIAHRVNLSQTPSWNRIRRMESEGVITGRVTTVDPRKVGLNLTVFVEVEAASHDPEWASDFKVLVATLPEVMEFYRMAGDTDYLLKVVVCDMDAYDRFYNRLVGRLKVKKVASHFTLENLLTRTVLPI